MKPSTLQFLKDLAANNNREWFGEHKDRYHLAQQDVSDFVESLIEEIGKFDEDILKIDPKKSLFRIYRDVRFSVDKSPYKTNFGAALAQKLAGRKAGYYLHIEPGKSFLAGGLYCPQPGELKVIRKEISANAQEFKAIIENTTFRNNFRGLSVENKLKRVPNDYEKEDPMAEYLKLKSFTVSHPVSDEQLLKPSAAADFAKIFKSLKPLNDFLELPFH